VQFAINRAYRDASRREQGLNDATLRPIADSLSANAKKLLYSRRVATLNDESRR